MRSSAKLTMGFATPEEALRVAAALAPENEAHLRVAVEGATLRAEAEADGPLALLHTLDDALACLSAAQRSSRAAQR